MVLIRWGISATAEGPNVVHKMANEDSDAIIQYKLPIFRPARAKTTRNMCVYTRDRNDRGAGVGDLLQEGVLAAHCPLSPRAGSDRPWKTS